MTLFKKTALSAALFALTGTASAGIVTNDTELLSGAGHEQLSTWLGEDVDLTRIFAKGIDGSTAAEWHEHVNYKGRTFSLIELFNGDERRIVGGYNEFNWLAGSTSTRSASVNNFLFNLSDSRLFQKNTRNDYQVLHQTNSGPTFGAGHDLYIGRDLSNGYANIGNSYGDIAQYQSTTYQESFTGSYNAWTVGKLETFTLSASTGAFGSGAKAMTDEQGNAIAANVSTPLGLGMLSLSLLALGLRRRAQSQ
jgi:hypothetical protein